MSIPLIGPDGRQYEIDDESKLDAALKAGYRVETAETPQTFGESAKSVLADIGEATHAAQSGVLEGLTAGAYGAAVGNLGDAETREAVKREQERSPMAYGAGELAGMVASPVNKVGELVRGSIGATTKLGRIGASIAGGASSGVLFGAGKTVSDAALGDTDLTAENLIAGGGLGALLGGAGGGIGGLVEEGARAVLPGVRSLAARASTALDDIANDATISATRATQNALGRVGDARASAAAKLIRDEGLIDANPAKTLKALEGRFTAAADAKNAALDAAEAAGARPSFADLRARVDQFEKSLGPLERKSVASSLKDFREAIDEIGARPATAMGDSGSGFRALDKERISLAKRAKFSRGPAGVDDETLQLKRQLAGVVRDEIDRQLVPQMGSDIGKSYSDAKTLYGTLKDAAALAKSGSGHPPGGIGMKDLLWGVAGAVATGHPLGVAGALGAKVLREQGPALMARIADKLAKEPALKAMATSFAASLPAVLPQLGQYGAALAQEARLGPERALAAHIAMSQLDPAYASTAQLAGLQPETPEEAPHVMRRAQTLAEATAAVQAHEAAMRRAVDRVFRGEARPSELSAMKTQDFGAMRMRREDGYDKRVAEIRELSTNPEALVERVAANAAGVGSVAPALVASMTNAAHRAVAYLAQQAEVPPKAGPLAPEWDVPEADRFTFAEKLETVQSPMSVLESAAAGTLTETQLEALRAVYPRLAQRMSDMAMERMLEQRGHVPYRTRLMVGMLTGLDVDGTMGPEAVAANQAAIMASRQSRQGAPEGAPQDSEDVTLAERTATPTERREMRADG